ncbi:MAG: beta-galactosidase, partial [Clostridia bacterium]|nr:beta-galactosidase [Clostridia bacterium]
PLFLEMEKRYLDQIFAIVGPRQITKGGNVLMVQVENEYGSYGNDHVYLAHLADYYRACGIDTLLFTSDGACDWMLGGGTIPGVLATANFGSNWKDNFAELKDFRPDQPCMCAEFWEGWFDSWYTPHHRREPDDVAELYDGMLGSGGSANFYMFTGGTNFGFHNGANQYDKYFPQTTSYDYDAMLTEAGDLAPRFYAVRAVNEKYADEPLPPLTVKNSAKAAYGSISLTSAAPLLDSLKALTEPVQCAYPMTMEELGVDFGYTLYETVIDYAVEDRPLEIDPIRDRVHIFLDGKLVGIKERDRRDDEVRINVPKGGSVKLSLLVENMGRVNYGITMSDNNKGLPGGARLGQQYLFGWTIYPLPMDDLSKLPFGEVPSEVSGPIFLKGDLVIEGEPADTFLRPEGFTKGFIMVNGFNLGRYFNPAGPQKTLYLPAPLLREGHNEIIVFESDGFEAPVISSEAEPDIG